MKITDAIFRDFLNCKTKAFLGLQGESSPPSDYQRILIQLTTTYKNEALKKLFIRYKESQVVNLPISTLSALQEGHRLITDTYIDSGELCSYCNAIEKTKGTSQLGAFYYVPILFTAKEKIAKEDKLILAFTGLVLDSVQKRQPEYGKIIYGAGHKASRITLDTQIAAAQKVVDELKELTLDGKFPRLILNSHCRTCEFREPCRTKALEMDDLSLLSGIPRKEIEKQNNKGIFTVTQYSYTFRPRRKRKAVKLYAKKHLFELQALAIRNGKIYIYERPQIPLSNVQIYYDTEGDPFRDYNYLIGVVIIGDGSEKRYSFWSDDEDGEKTIFSQFICLLKPYSDFYLYHYGNYETRLLKKMQSKLRGEYKRAVDGILRKSINVFSNFYGDVYFPTYSNKLKEIGRYLGFHWADEKASGEQSVVWRKRWEQNRAEELKQQLIQYNLEDCLALKKLTEFLYNISTADNLGIKIGEGPELIYAPKLQAEPNPRKWRHTLFCFPDLDYINRCAYFDYQRHKIYLRTNKGTLKPVKDGRRKQKLYGRINKYLKFNRPRKCPLCGCKQLHKTRYIHRKVFDLKFSQGGMKKWITKYRIGYYTCTACGKNYTPTKHYIKSKYGHGLISWMVYQNIANYMSGGQIKRTLEDAFALSVSSVIVVDRFRPLMAGFYKRTYNNILKTIITGSIVFADETQIDLRDGSGYVWVFASVEEIYFFFTETREGEFLKKMLKNFNGVLVSDFYAVYSSINCPQQKCLIHLIRDLNDEFFKNQLDYEFKELLQRFTALLRQIVDTIDKRGLKKRYLNKHQKDVRKFFREICRKEYRSELAQKYQKRFEKNQGVLFTFLEYDGVPWNNNNAEHAIKEFAEFRKRNVSRFTRASIKEFLILLSVWQTCKYKGLNFLNFLLSRERDIDRYQLSKS